VHRYRVSGWALILGPVLLVLLLRGDPLTAATGLAAGALLLFTAAAGFRDLARA
jgi:hypothetical protein